jgi:hypothetical protein
MNHQNKKSEKDLETTVQLSTLIAFDVGELGGFQRLVVQLSDDFVQVRFVHGQCRLSTLETKQSK